ncbi:siderophore-interacting protein [Nocardia sp. NPDC058497]|uniref:siderophore-interacting protein n=1 Tax=Nocardia sp. NPDC058497 TaxID=3346529 RepID=UPI0036598004
MTAVAANRSTMAYATLRVRRVVRLTPRMVRITLTCANPAALADAGADQYTKLFFPLPGQERPAVPPPVDDAVGGVMGWYQRYLAMPDEIRPPMRTYTIRAQRPALGEIDIDFALHPDHAGPASDWASTAASGDEIGLLCPPRALYSPQPDPAWQLLVGDETAIPAIGAIVESLDAGVTVRAFIEVAGRRNLVRDRGIDKRAITFTGYWRQGRTEEDNGREKVRRAAAGEPLVDED